MVLDVESYIFAAMLVATQNYDVICFQMWMETPHLSHSMRKELDDLLQKVRKALSVKANIKNSIDELIPFFFNFRIKAFKSLAQEGSLSIDEALDTVLPQIEKLKDNRKLEILSENILFALRCNNRVIESLTSSGNLSAHIAREGIVKLPSITYEQFVASIAFSIPDDETAQKVIDWTNSSLYIEFIVLAAVLTHEEKLKVSDKIINELSFLVADAAQNYSAIALELGILKSHSTKSSIPAFSVDKAFIREQKNIADLGIDDFAKSL